MSHFLTVVFIEDYPQEEIEKEYAGVAAEKLRSQEAQAGTIFYDHPLTGKAKVVRTYAEEAAGKLLAPYNENTEVEPYEKPCYCVGRKAERWATDEAKRQRPDLFDLDSRRARARTVALLWSTLEHEFPEGRRAELLASAEFQAKATLLGLGEIIDRLVKGDESVFTDETVKAKLEEVDQRLDAEWDALWKEREGLVEQLAKTHPEYGKPDPTCGWYHYQHLDLDKTASAEEIRSAIRTRLEETQAELGAYDPKKDVFGSTKRGFLSELEYLAKIDDVLLDPAKRAEYDASDPREDDSEEGCGGTGVVKSTYNPVSEWDWWVIGGRWAGVFSSDYDPGEDERNLEPCDFCNATGKRYWAIREDGETVAGTGESEPAEGLVERECNGCGGTGRHRRFHNAEFDGDIVPASELLRQLEENPEEVAPYALLTPEDGFLSRGKMGWWGMSSGDASRAEWVEKVREIVAAQAELHRLAVACDLHI